MMSNATLFIPDISGFTKFVKATELLHSKHIVEELINIIIRNGSDLFEVAEIEGDAVFFFKEEKISTEEVIRVARKIFVAFHSHISFYETGRICNCGACLQAIDLKLKFIVHAGEISLAKFGSQKAKPYGDSVIEVHRLLKNEITSKQYILFTEKFLEDSQSQFDEMGVLSDPSLGNIPYHFLKIDHWKSDVVTQVEKLIDDRVDIVTESVAEVAMDSNSLFQYISDFKYRHFWNQSAEKIVFDENKVNQVGDDHYCIVKGKDLYFNTIKPTASADTLTYGEVLRNPSPLKYFETNFLLNPSSINRTRLKLVLRASVRWRIQLLLLPLLKKKLKSQASDVLKSIQESVLHHQSELAEDLQI